MKNSETSDRDHDAECFICRKHRGLEAAPPGGYIFIGDHWRVCHAPGKIGPLGTLFIESTRHFLDYAQMTDAEAGALGECLRAAYAALHEHTGAWRIYQVSLNEGVPHFHTWLVPRMADAPEKGVKYLALDLTCRDDEAAVLAASLREWMKA